MLSSLAGCLTSTLPHYSTQGLAMVAAALSHFNYTDDTLYAKLADVLHARLRDVGSTAAGSSSTGMSSVGTTIRTYRSSGSTSGSGFGSGSSAVAATSTSPPAIDMAAVSSLTCSLAKAGVRRPALWDAVLEAVARVPPGELGCIEAVSILWTVAHMQHACQVSTLDLLVAVAARDLGCSTRYSHRVAGSRAAVAPDAQVNVDSARGRPSKAQARGSLMTAPAAAGELVGGMLTQQKPDGGLISMLLVACAQLRYQPPRELLKAAGQQLVGQCDHLSSHTLCDIIHALASLQVSLGQVVWVDYACW